MNNVHTSDPLEQFNAWYAEAGTDVVALGTATPDGAPAARMVLLKGADLEGFTFFTNYESRKGRELADNPRGALLFHWPQLGRQGVREGGLARRWERLGVMRGRSLRADIGDAGGAASGRTRKWMRHCTDGLQSGSLSAACRLALP